MIDGNKNWRRPSHKKKPLTDTTVILPKKYQNDAICPGKSITIKDALIVVTNHAVGPMVVGSTLRGVALQFTILEIIL